MSKPISLNYVKQMVESFEECDVKQMDELAFAWIEQMLEDYGKDGQIAIELLAIIKKLAE